MRDVDIHITFNSTSVLDAAMIGIPTIFIDMHDPQSPNEIFFNQYKYPCENLVINDYPDFENLLTEFENIDIYEDYGRSVQDWSFQLYQDFDEIKFKDFLLELINNDKR